MISEKQQFFLGRWPRAQPTPTLHPSHFLTGWSHFHNRSLVTRPALSTALPKHLETICHLLHQHTTITLFPQQKPATPAASPSPASNHPGQNQAPGTAFAYIEPRKQEDRAISPSVCLFVIEEQPNLNRAWLLHLILEAISIFWLQPEQVTGTRPGELLHCPAEGQSISSPRPSQIHRGKRCSLLHHS